MADVCPSLLRDTSLNVEERLKIACVIARNGSTNLGERKVAFLTKWACQEICNVYSKKTRSPPTMVVCSQLWIYLATMLESEQLIRHKKREEESQDVTKTESFSGAPISIHLIQAMCNVLKSQDAVVCVDPVLNCMMLILRQPPPLPAVFYKFEIVVSLLTSLLVLAGRESEVCHSSASDRSGELQKQVTGNTHLVHTTLCLLLEQFNYLQSTQGNQKKVFIAICSQLLPSVITIRQSLQDGALLDKLDTLLSSLFSKDHLGEYSSALSSRHSPTETGGRKSDISYTKLLFSGLKELLDDAPTCQKWTAVLSVIPILFKAFLQQNSNMKKKLSRTMEFSFFLKVLWIFGFPATTADKQKKKNKLRCRTTIKKVKVEEAEDEMEKEEKVGIICDEGSGDETSEGNKTEETVSENKEEEDSDDELESVDENECVEENTIDWEAWVVGIQTEGDVVEDWEENVRRRFKEPVLKVLVTCLQLLRVHNVYQAIEDQSSGNRQFRCLSNLCMELVQNINKHNISAVAGCLEEVLQLNHKLIEPLLVHLLLLTTSHSESRLKMNSFVQKCITIYSKLHQLGVLVSVMFSVFEKIAMSPSLCINISPALSKSSEDWFCKHIQQMPVGQSVALLEQLTNSFQSIFLTRLPRTRKKRKHNHRESGLESISDNFNAALLCGVNVFSLVLQSTPLTVWTSEGLHKEKAMEALLGIQRDISLPLMIAATDILMLCTGALCISYTLQGLIYCISATMPALSQPSLHHTDDTSSELAITTASCENDRLHLMSEKTRLVWCEESCLPIPKVWQSDSFAERERVFTASTTYLLKAMSVRQLRFARDHYTPEEIAHLLNFVFATMEFADGDEHTSMWSGQILSVNDGNLTIAVGELALSSLPLFYKDYLSLHLQNIALFLHSALLGASVNNRDHEGDGGKTAREVAVGFLHSQVFQDMRRLHESLLALCFDQAAALLPKRFKELKTSMQCCNGQLLDSSDHLEKVIEQGIQLLLLGDEDDHHHMKKRKSVLKSTQHLSVCLEIMRMIPMSFSHPELLQRCILALTIQHIILVYSLCFKEVLTEKEPFCQLQELHVVLIWVLASLVNCDRVGMKKKTPRLSPLPFSLLLNWFFISSKHCASLEKDKTKELQTSFLLLMEAALENALKIGSFPTSFVQSIMEDVSAVVAGTGEAIAQLAVSVFHLTTIKICKMYSDLKLDHRVGSFLHQPMQDLLRETSVCLSQLRKKSPESMVIYTQLVSGFSLLFRTNPPSDTTHKSKSVKVLKLLIDMFCCDDALHVAVSNPSMLFAVIDVLSLAVTRMKEEEATRHNIVCMTVTESWMKSVTLLKKYLEYDLKQPNSSTCNYLTELYSDHIKNKVSDCDIQRILPRIDGLIMHLIAAADREQIILMFQLLHRESCDSVAVALTVCHCWNVILGAKLQPESQRELRKWHTKILLQCESLAIQHREAIPVVIMSLNITTHLVALPAKVGLDSRLVILSLHQTAVIGDFQAPEIEPQRCVPLVVIQSVGQLLHTVLKNHSSVATSCPGPVITSINNLVKVFLKLCTLEDEERETSIANTISRVFDHLAGRQEFNKFIACVLCSYIETVVKHLPPKAIKTTILPGVYSLLRHCSENDVAYIQSSLDLTSRTLFQSLLVDFRKQKRYV